jgi:hypothetical protein
MGHKAVKVLTRLSHLNPRRNQNLLAKVSTHKNIDVIFPIQSDVKIDTS